jgi:riboflavin synthase
LFTGIVEAVGSIASVSTHSSGARRLRIHVPGIAASLSPGDSMAVDGVCLTVEFADAEGFDATAVPETLSRTTLSERAAGEAVNLERAATLERYFGGHLVQGHVDGVARVVSFGADGGTDGGTDGDAAGDAPTLVLDLPGDVFALCVEKGSIAVDGVSLTIASLAADSRIAVAIAPYTRAHTTCAGYRPGRRVNVEADLIAKYVREFVRRA